MAHVETEDREAVKRMAELLRQGFTLTELACPVCASPIFRMKNGDLWCEKCRKKVIVVRDEEELAKIRGAMALENLENILLSKIEDIQRRMQDETDVEKLQKLSTALSELLDSLEKIRKAKRK
ncbi:MAG: Sjogren's syndrome/scleroderma autoantigen 1 family protein [Candidatus Bathyarchaeia archaeon]